VVTDLFYVVYASGEVQPWNDETGKSKYLVQILI
jgi:hypothetical protein